MLCVVCGLNTRVVKTREISGGREISRRRECEASPPHFFVTNERSPGVSLDTVRVRQSGNNELHPNSFDRERVHEDVAKAVLKRLSEREVADTVDEVAASLERRLPTLVNAFRESDNLDPLTGGWIWDGDVTSTVEDQLARRDRMAAVLYALVVRGRRDRKGRLGWKSAKDVLEWLPLRFAHIDTRVATPRATPTQEWYPPSSAPRPERVVKRVEDQGRGNPSPDYDHGRFLRSIEKALEGRLSARTTAEARMAVGRQSELIAQWVLWGLVGQNVVLTSQLSVGVMDALRRTDDVAYLRWACMAKRMVSVRDFAAEVRALIEQPSPRLRFDEYTLTSPQLLAAATAARQDQ